ncbi:hypothetical protein B0H10DRAFT_2360895 [Mycena sp. CBHHK59/15]|nr:hypothetical protein B0H10DRAFT_2360895 [Mycena sp. CBHHK59/15]
MSDPTPTRLPPFSLLEFSDLVSAALDPPAPAPAPALAFTLGLERKKSAQNLQLPRGTGRPPAPKAQAARGPALPCPAPHALRPRRCAVRAVPPPRGAVRAPLARSFNFFSVAVCPVALRPLRDLALNALPPALPTASSFSTSTAPSTSAHHHPHRPWSVLTIADDAPPDDPFAKGAVRVVHSCEALPYPSPYSHHSYPPPYCASSYGHASPSGHPYAASSPYASASPYTHAPPLRRRRRYDWPSSPSPVPTSPAPSPSSPSPSPVRSARAPSPPAPRTSTPRRARSLAHPPSHAPQRAPASASPAGCSASIASCSRADDSRVSDSAYYSVSDSLEGSF